MVNKAVSKGAGAPVVIGAVLALVLSLGLIEGGLWAAVGIGGAVLAALFMGYQERVVAWPARPVWIALGCFVLCGVLSSGTSLDPKGAFSTFLKSLSFLVPLALWSSPRVREAGRRALPFFPKLNGFFIIGAAALLSSLIVATGLYGVEDPAVTKLNRGLSYACGLLWPLAGVVFPVKAGKGERALVALSLLVAILLLTHSRATLLGVVAGVGAALAMARWPRLAMAGIVAGIVAALAWPFVINQGFVHAHDLLYKVSGSWLHRIEIWDYLSYRILERPWLGWGMGATKLLDWTIPHGAMYWANAFPVSHPHNIFVQLWVEFGAVGVAFAAGIFAALVRSLWGLAPSLRPWGAGALTYFIVVSLCAYNLWTDSFWAAISLTSFLFAVLSPRRN